MCIRYSAVFYDFPFFSSYPFIQFFNYEVSFLGQMPLFSSNICRNCLTQSWLQWVERRCSYTENEIGTLFTHNVNLQILDLNDKGQRDNRTESSEMF